MMRMRRLRLNVASCNISRVLHAQQYIFYLMLASWKAVSLSQATSSLHQQALLAVLDCEQLDQALLGQFLCQQAQTEHHPSCQG